MGIKIDFEAVYNLDEGIEYVDVVCKFSSWLFNTTWRKQIHLRLIPPEEAISKFRARSERIIAAAKASKAKIPVAPVRFKAHSIKG